MEALHYNKKAWSSPKIKSFEIKKTTYSGPSPKHAENNNFYTKSAAS